MKLLLGLLTFLTTVAVADTPAELIAAARELARTTGETVWPGLGADPFGVLLVAGDQETLFCADGSAMGFTGGEVEPATGCQYWVRPRTFQPNLLASFPLSDGTPTIVVGTPDKTGRDPMDWVLTLLHEHLHQLQYAMEGYHERVQRLDLAAGDTTGMWMLNYPFPYHDPAIASAITEWGRIALETLDTADSDQYTLPAKTFSRYLKQRAQVQALVSESDWRYAELQLWQEGVARWLELAVARAAAPDDLTNVDGFGQLATRKLAAMREELAELSSPKQRRVIFYSLGAAEAMMLDALIDDWPAAYWRHPFALGVLLRGIDEKRF